MTLPELQHTTTAGDEIWWYQDKGPQMRVWENSHGPAHRRWEVKVYPTYRDCWLTHMTWYHDAFPDKLGAVREGRERLDAAARYWESSQQCGIRQRQQQRSDKEDSDQWSLPY